MDYRQGFENQERSDVLNVFPSGVTRFVAGNSHLLLTRFVSLGMNGSDIEQISDSKDIRLPLELVDILNESISYSAVWFSFILWCWISIDVPTTKQIKQKMRSKVLENGL